MAKKRRRRKAVHFTLKKDTTVSLFALGLWILGGLVLLSFSHQGELLRSINQSLLDQFGPATLALPFLFVTAGFMIQALPYRLARPQVFFGSILVFVAGMGLLQGGQMGTDLFAGLAALVWPAGAALILIGVALAGILIMTEASLADLFYLLGKIGEGIPRPALRANKAKGLHISHLPGMDQEDKALMEKLSKADRDSEVEPETDSEPAPSTQPIAPPVRQPVMPPPNLEGLSSRVQTNTGPMIWREPPLSLLQTSTGKKADRGNVKQNADLIEGTLKSFNIKAKIVDVSYGPAVTQFALKISEGTKLSKIMALQNDLALNLAAPTGQIRIEAPIPGKPYVGIEVPNIAPEYVTLRQMLKSDEMRKSRSKLTVALGLNVAGQPLVADIAQMPHVLIAGATGSGKSVLLNAFMATMLFRASPQEVKFILVDPKRVELTGYNDIPHLLTPVIVEPEKVVSALKWAVNEMKERYKMFSEVGVRNIAGYNELSGFQALPFIVIVIDELADIMLFAPKEVEEAITRIAQMARAVGIHLVLATQRPSVDVLTGLIKANIPTRIAFNVASMVDSRVIIDSPGAEKLLGRGDMLYIPPTQSKPTRIQGAYVSDAEINSLIAYLKESGVTPQYSEEITTKYQTSAGKPGAGGQMDDDPLFKEAVEMVISQKKASTSMIQRQLRIGYNRAARIMEAMIAMGIVSTVETGSKPRDVLVRSMEEYQARNQQS